MDKKTEALKLALEALELHGQQYPHMVKGYCLDAITAIREALAEQPELEEGCQCPACKIAPHESDCPVHNEPAWPNGPCDCGAQPSQHEPVALGYMNAGHVHEMQQGRLPYGYVYPKGGTGADVALYTSPPASKPWVGLTDEQISDMWDGHTVPVFGKTGINPIVFARAIEAKLREKNEHREKFA